MERYLFARKLLTGAARKAIEADDTVVNYELLIQKLKKEFEVKWTVLEVHEKLIKRKKTSSETYLEYMYEMQRIGKTMEAKSIIQYVINGIQDDPIGKTILYEATTMDELKTKLKVYETIRSQRKIEKPQKIKFNQKIFSADNVDSSSSTNSRCFNCGSKSHQRNECPDKAKGARCFKCNNFGHRAKECQEKKSTSVGYTEKPKQVSRIVSAKDPGDGQIVVRHEEDNIVAMVDSGSPVTMMKISVYKILKTKPELKNSDRSFLGFGNVLSKTLGSAKFKFIIDGEEYQCDCFIVKDSHIVDDMLIGKDILNQADVNIRRGKVSMKKINVEIEEDDETFVGRIQDFHYVEKSLVPEVNLSHISDKKIRDEVQTMINNYKPKVPEKSCVEMKVLLADERPVYEKARRLSPKERELVNDTIKDWIHRGICRPSNSQYASPIVLRPKKNGLYRLCVDFRRLNKKVIRDRYPLPIMEDVVDVLQGAVVYTTIDLRDGFFHVDVTEESVKFLSFIVPDGQYEFLKAPFGFTNSPSMFQRFINTVFRQLMNEKIMATYLDDLATPGKSMQNGLENFKKVLAKAEENGLLINWKKSKILVNKVEFLGFVVENGEIKPSDLKTRAVQKFPTPSNVKQVQSFLGLTGFFRKFIYNYSVIARPLSDLTRKNVKFEFGEDQYTAFNTLKAALCDEPVLKLFNPECEITQLHTDASKLGLGATLLQKDSEDQKLHPVCYLSWKTTPTQEKLDSYDLEALAIYKALKKLRIYLHGLKFEIFTDCSAFQRSMEKKELVARVAKWALYISQFDSTMKHRQGSKMLHVDALSRIPAIMMVEDGLITKVRNLQNDDDKCKMISEILKTQSYGDYTKRSGIVYVWENGAQLILVPKKLENEIIRAVHERGHIDCKKTEAIIKKEYFIGKLAKKVSQVIANCIPCILATRKEGKKEGFLRPIDKDEVPIHTYHVDHLGPLASTAKSYKHILVVIDAFSKFTWIYPVKTTNAAEVMRKLVSQ